MLKSNGEEAFANIAKVVLDLKPDDVLVSQIVFSLHANNIRRVHQEGKAYTGRTIGQYSTSPIYVNPANSPVRFSPQGKNGESVFKSGKRKKTKYFDGGYKGFKRSIGRLRETSNVNLRLFGDLQRGFIPEKRGNRWVIGIVGSQVEKYNGLVTRYGPFYGVAKEDEDLIDKTLRQRLQ